MPPTTDTEASDSGRCRSLRGGSKMPAVSPGAARGRPTTGQRQKGEVTMPEPDEGSGSCPECSSDLELEGYDFDVGETLNCPECSVEIRVISASPLLVVLDE